MATWIGGGEDPAFLDDILLKEGTLDKWIYDPNFPLDPTKGEASKGKFEKRLNFESPTEWYDDWNNAEPSTTLTIDVADWRVHYFTRYPITFMHNKKFVFGVKIPPSLIHIDQDTDDICWARLGDHKVVVERSDYPRFTTRNEIEFSHTPKITEFPNVFRLGNGYSIACNKIVTPIEFGAVTEGEAWWMVGPTSEEAELSRRVLMIKVYDGPYRYQSRGTDIRLSDPAPLASDNEYVIYSYDEQGMRGLYRELYSGISPQKHAMTVRGEELQNQIREKTGNYGFKDGQITGPCKVRYVFPLNATKLLKVEHRGSEVVHRFKPDDTPWVTMQNYDGRAVSELEIEFDVYSSLGSFRIEWESLKDWVPVGRPKVDILPAGWGGNLVRLELEENEGLSQVNDLYTGAYTVSANVRCYSGQAIVDVGGIEIVNWNPLDKSVRGAGDFVASNDEYEFTLTGNGPTVYEIDRFRVAEAGQKEWIPQDIQWWVETEAGEFDATDSINNPDTPVAVGEAKRWRVGVQMPENTGDVQDVAISGVYNEAFRTGSNQILRHVKWAGEGKSRLYYPQNVTNLPAFGDWLQVDGMGAIAWEQEVSHDEGDVLLLLDGSLVAYREEYTYRPVTIQNRRWRVEIGEERADIYLDNNFVGYMIGTGLPFRIAQNNSEDVQLDCSGGFVQLRRELGPRFEGWGIGTATEEIATLGPRTAWGTNIDEANDNLPFYVVRIGR